MDKQIVTVWYRQNNKNKEFEFNHYEEGYDETQTVPVTDIPKQQKDWKKAKWRKKFGHLIVREGNALLIEENNESGNDYKLLFK